MALYALGDLHLSFQADKPMDMFGKVWRNHEKKIEKNCNKILTDEDTLVLVGDHSWGRKLSDCEMDLKFIEDLPGKKVLIRGNHDTFWDAKKTGKLNELFAGRLFFLQNNYYPYGDYALWGPRGSALRISGQKSMRICLLKEKQSVLRNPSKQQEQTDTRSS